MKNILMKNILMKNILMKNILMKNILMKNILLGTLILFTFFGLHDFQEIWLLTFFWKHDTRYNTAMLKEENINNTMKACFFQR